MGVLYYKMEINMNFEENNTITKKPKKPRKPRMKKIEKLEKLALEKLAIDHDNYSHNDNGNNTTYETTEKKQYKKRGRKPKGGKIIKTEIVVDDKIASTPNIILHLKCKKHDIINKLDITNFDYVPKVENVENFTFENNKSKYLEMDIFSNENDVNIVNKTTNDNIEIITNKFEKEEKSKSFIYFIEDKNNTNKKVNETVNYVKENKNNIVNDDEQKNITMKLNELFLYLHNNNINNKKSACFWDTCDFDTPVIQIPKYIINEIYHCYGCFCSPECAVAYLFKENLDTSTKFERYHLIINMYGKIFNYVKNFKPSPDPFYTLDKYYGNLNIQEYRKLLKSDRLLLIVDKPCKRILPELHEDNNDLIVINKKITNKNKK